MTWGLAGFAALELASWFQPPEFETIDDLIRRFDKIEDLGDFEIDGEKCAGVKLSSVDLGTMELYFALEHKGLYKKIVCKTPKYEVERVVDEFIRLSGGKSFPNKIHSTTRGGNGESPQSHYITVSKVLTDIETFPNGDDPRFGFRFPKFSVILVTDALQNPESVREAKLLVLGEDEKPLFQPRDIFELEQWCKDNGFPGHHGFSGGPPPESEKPKWMNLLLAISVGLFAVLIILAAYLRRKRKAPGDKAMPSVN